MERCSGSFALLPYSTFRPVDLTAATAPLPSVAYPAQGLWPIHPPPSKMCAVESEQTTSNKARPPASGRLTTVIKELTKARNSQRVRAGAFGAVAVAAAVTGILFLAHQASSALGQIQDAARSGASDTAIAAETTFLIIRGTGLAAIVGGVIYFLLNLARSAIDQATRYDKRLIASHLIDYALHEPEVSGPKLEAAHKIVDVWGSTVESAYTPPRVAKRVGGMNVSVSKDGVSMQSDSSQP